MEEVPDYSLETQLFDGVISVETYFSQLEKALGGTAKNVYAKRLRDLRLHYARQNPFTSLINGLKQVLNAGRDNYARLSEQDVAEEWGVGVTKEMAKKYMMKQMHEDVLGNINIEHNNLRELARQGLVKRLQDPSESGG